jgi:hypothetical protein
MEFTGISRSAAMEWLFVICYRSRDILFEVGFCHEWRDTGRSFLVRSAFVKSTIQTPLGPIQCRGIWGKPSRLNKKQYEISICMEEPWMDLHVVDVMWAERLCEECAIELPPNGFRRL